MDESLTEAWAEIARLQNSRATSKNQAAVSVCEIMIDRQLDRIAENQIDRDDPSEVRRIVAASARRERHRIQLVRRHGPSLYLGQFSVPSPEAIYSGRQALRAVLEQSSPADVSLLLSVGLGETPQIPGITISSARQRLCRLRGRLSHLAH